MQERNARDLTRSLHPSITVLCCSVMDGTRPGESSVLTISGIVAHSRCHH